MHHFEYRGGILHAEEVNLEALAKEVGTPFYCYSGSTLRRHYNVFAGAFAGQDTLVAFSVKALSNLAALKLLAAEGAGADVVSGGELRRALTVGIAPEKIVFSGVGKTEAELATALDAAIHQFNVESEPELALLNEIALAKGVTAPVAIRVNPDVSAGGHDKISTGRAEDKFGIAWRSAERVFQYADTLPGLDVCGVDIHIGSQITALDPFRAAFEKVAGLIGRLRAQGQKITRLDLGGGLGIPYASGPDAPVPPHPDDYAALIREISQPLDVQLIFEPGRMIAGNAGILLARIIYVKQGEDRKFYILDAAMNDLIRPTLYDAWHDLIPVHACEGEVEAADVVGPVCETGDTFMHQRALPLMQRGDLVAFMTAGAYGAVQACEYNSRPLVPEVLVEGARHAVIRRRPTLDEMFARECVPDWLG